MHLTTPRRSAKTIAAIAVAAAGSLAAARMVSAQIWVNPNTSTWSNATNWVGGVPASANTTQLTFNAIAAQTYTATNDVANPFSLNAINFNNTGTGQINVAGSTLSFGGTNPAINIAGSGLSTISNNIQSTTAGTPLTVGGAGSGTVNLSGGGTLYAINGASGAINITGGAWTLTSTNRRNDTVGGINDGFWSLNIGDVAGQTARFSMTGGTMTAEHGMVGVTAGAVGIATFSGAGTTAVFNPNAPTASRFGVSAGTGTYTVQSGASVTGNFFEVSRQVNALANVFVTSGGTINAQQQVLIGRSAGGHGSLTINTGGRVNNGSNSFVGAISGATGTLLVTGAGSQFENVNRLITGGGGATGGTANVIVNSGGVIRSGAGYTFTQNDGGSTNVTVDGPGSAITSLGIGAGTGSWASGVGIGGQTTFNVTNGATVGVGGALFMSGGIVDAVGDPVPSGTTTFNITGAGANTSTANIGFLQMGQNPGGHSTYNANTLSTTNVGTNLIVGLDPTGVGTLNVNGTGAVINTPGFVAPFPATDAVGDPIPGGDGQVNITGGAVINTSGYGFLIAGNPQQVGTLTVSGTNSRLLGTGTAELDVAIDGVGTMNVLNGGLVSSAGASTGQGSSFIAANPNSSGAVNVNAGTFIVGNQLQIAGSGGDNGGTGIVTVTNNGHLQANGLAVVYATGTLNIGAGTTPARTVVNNDMAVDGRVNYNSGTFNATGTLAVAGRVQLSDAARLPDGTPTNKKTLDVGQFDLNDGSGNIIGVVDLNDNDAIVRNQPRAQVEALIVNARNGGAWNQPGITSTAALNSAAQNTTLGVIDGSDYISVQGSTFNGRTVNANDRVVKYTWYGDSDFNGVVDFDDYVRLDAGFNGGLTGWFNGDFDLSGSVDFDDYVLIDLGFNTQNQTLGRLGEIFRLAGPDPSAEVLGSVVARFEAAGVTLTPQEQMAMDHAVQFGNSYVNGFLNGAVPEPAAASSLVLGGLAALARRRRRA